MGISVIRSVLLFDGHVVRPNATVSIDSESGLIISVEDGSTSTPAEAHVIDGSGHTLVPGLLDSHIHIHGLHLADGADEPKILDAALRCGITTVLDMHSDPEDVSRWRSRIARDSQSSAESNGPVKYPDLKSSLLGATIKGGWPEAIVRAQAPEGAKDEVIERWPRVTSETAEEFVTNQKAAGADYIKLLQEDMCCFRVPARDIQVASLELQTRLTDAGHAQGFVVVGHALSADMTKVILTSGADGLTHTFIDQAPSEEIISLYKKTGAFVIPTLCVLSSITNEEEERRKRFATLAFEQGVIDDKSRDVLVATMNAGAPEATVQHAFATVRRLHQDGIDIVAGTDSVAGLPGTAIGPSLWMELDLYVHECGMSTVEALRSATSIAAKRFNFDDRGVIAKGKRADLVLVKGDLIQSIDCLFVPDAIVSVWKEGRIAQLN